MVLKQDLLLRDFQNLEVLSINKEVGHTPLFAFESEDAALNHCYEEDIKDTRNLKLLTPPGSRWLFHFSPCPDAAPAIACAGFEGSEHWGDIAVPCNWECEGHGQAIYTNFQYPFKVF
jgi:beta-galactosidase